ncbi:UTP--GlnB (protein PII) uridylyltransferase GlnD [Nitrospirillum amazonense]|uniref:Bifunctional uridylyltransferase/uridylyl-removing enzyme n=2 Tax=Nitrospirillum amazonense TaxID=28077 RepID=A0A560FLK0_9PROT|nr:UTP--GlnB (protein PII) uridylyltransferase GlnD [Nitrospirillum amazonense]
MGHMGRDGSAGTSGADDAAVIDEKAIGPGKESGSKRLAKASGRAWGDAWEKVCAILPVRPGTRGAGAPTLDGARPPGWNRRALPEIRRAMSPVAKTAPIPLDETALPEALPTAEALTTRMANLADGDLRPDALRAGILALMRQTLDQGRALIRRRLENGGRGEVCLREATALTDAIVVSLADFALHRVFPTAGPTRGEQFAVVATGGYGRKEMAPFSDVDLLFLLPYKRTPRIEQVVEYVLYLLWDMGLKVGHAVRSVDECVRQALGDITIRTSLLEARFLYGDDKLYAEFRKRFTKEVVANTGPAFIEAKLAERDSRHLKFCDSRYVLEPNVKEGKGGLRDLQTLFWIAKYVYQVDKVKDLVANGVLLAEEAQRFAKAQNFLWTCRCHLHYLTGRGEDRLTFDVQGEMARRLGYTDHAGTSDVERFMKHYFLMAKDVGDLTRILCATLEQESQRPPRFAFLRRVKPSELEGFVIDNGRLSIRDERHFRDKPVDMVRLFRVAQWHNLDIHPKALRALARSISALGPKVRNDPEANRLFLEILGSRKDPEVTLRRMNEAGVLGRFLPDFGRVVAQMQYDMYHMFTVDEHTLFAMGILHDIEKGNLKDEVPLACEVIHTLSSKRALSVALLLHDVAKGRGGDHSILGAKVAEKLCPRLGMTEEETETVAWLVRQHLTMSIVAFKRDLDDEKTIRDFVDIVKSPERLKLLLVLTVADIRAVGPGRWNNWKATLLRQLYWRAEEMMSGGVVGADGREARIINAQGALRAQLPDWAPADVDHHLALGYPNYWLAFDPPTLAQHARLIHEAESGQAPLTIETRYDPGRSVTEVTIYTADHAGLFSRLAGAMALAGGDIVDARITTMTNGMALDVFSLQGAGPSGARFDSGEKRTRLKSSVEKALAGDIKLAPELAKRASPLPSRTRVFRVPPRVLVDNKASAGYTVIEVNGRDRPGLLYDLTRALTALNLQIASAKISTYGNAAVDVFYVKDIFGLKVAHEAKLTQIRKELLAVLDDPDPAAEQPKAKPAARRRTAAAAE